MLEESSEFSVNMSPVADQEPYCAHRSQLNFCYIDMFGTLRLGLGLGLGLGSGLGMWSGLGLVHLGTLSRYYCAHSITPSQPFGTVTTAFNKRHFANKNYESKH